MQSDVCPRTVVSRHHTAVVVPFAHNYTHVARVSAIDGQLVRYAKTELRPMCAASVVDANTRSDVYQSNKFGFTINIAEPERDQSWRREVCANWQRLRQASGWYSWQHGTQTEHCQQMEQNELGWMAVTTRLNVPHCSSPA